MSHSPDAVWDVLSILRGGHDATFIMDTFSLSTYFVILIDLTVCIPQCHHTIMTHLAFRLAGSGPPRPDLQDFNVLLKFGSLVQACNVQTCVVTLSYSVHTGLLWSLSSLTSMRCPAILGHVMCFQPNR